MSEAIRTYKKPRYKPEDYIGFTMPNGDMDVDIRNHTSHLVLCRKQHDCWNCGYFPMNCNPNDKKCKKNLEKEEK